MAVSAEVRRNATLVLVAGAVYFVLQATVTGFALPLGPYEQVLVPSLLTEDLWVLRLAVMVVSSLALVIAFRAWVRPAGKAAWASAAFVATSWAPVHYGPQARPEVLLMFACVAAAGFVTRWLVERDRGALAGGGLAVAVAMLLDPVIGIALALALAAVVLVWARGQGGPALVALGAGVVAGRAIAWLLRRVLSTGEALARVRSEEISGSGSGSALGLLEPLTAGDPTDVYRVAAGVLALGAAVLLGMFWQRWPHRHNAARVGMAVAVVLAIAVVLFSASATPMLLPAWGVLSIAAGAGLLAAWRTARDTGSAIATGLYVVVVVSFVVWQVVVAAAAA